MRDNDLCVRGELYCTSHYVDGDVMVWRDSTVNIANLLISYSGDQKIKASRYLKIEPT